MTKDCDLPVEKLFDHLNSQANPDGVHQAVVESNQHIAQHIAECAECRTTADLVGLLKQTAGVAVPAITSGPGRIAPTGQGSPGEVEKGSTKHPAPLTLEDVDGSCKPAIPGLSEEMWPALYQHDDGADRRPSTHELACFFYNNVADQPSDSRAGLLRELASPAVAAHVALCPDCARYVADFAKAEAIASDFAPPAAGAESSPPDITPTIPEQTWKLIAEWEESDLARPKPDADVIDCQMMETLLKLLSERRKEIYEMAQREILRHADRDSGSAAGSAVVPVIVPVIVVDQQGALQGVELFRSIKNENGAQCLEGFTRPERFENRILHAVMKQGQNEPVVASDRIHAGLARIPLAEVDPAGSKTDYFIIDKFE
ncbi:MAG TPA: hypothetical protein VLZ81_03410 [Blastocatellia bacterium]|nr:hypothetical protein [Blastocatellia bacterium]